MMKKVIVALVVFLFVSTATKAQQLLDLGIKGGYVSSKLTTDISDDNINSYMVGAFARVNIKSFYIQPEFYYSTKGNTSDLFDAIGDIDMSTYNIPLLFGFRLINNETFSLRINAGPVFSFVDSDGIYDQITEFDRVEFEDNYTGIQFGAGIDIYRFGIDISLEKDGSIADIDSESFDQNLFMVTLSYCFL